METTIERRPPSRKGHAKRPAAFTQAIELQRLAMDAAHHPKTSPSALAQLMRAWSELEERKRIIRMKPAPKPIDVTAKPKRQAHVVTPEEPS